MSIKKKLIRNTVFNYGIRLWSFLITYILLPLIVLYIGGDDYGIYLIITAFTGYFVLMDLGIGTSLVKFVAEYYAKGEKEKVNEMVNTAFFMYLGIGIAGASILLVIGAFVLDLFNIEPGFLDKARIITYLIAIFFITSFSLATFKEILRGMQRYDILAYISFVMSLVDAGVVLFVLFSGYGIIEFVFYKFCVGLIGSVFWALYAKKLLPYLDVGRKYINRALLPTLFELSILIFLLYLFGRIVYFTDNLVIGYFLGPALVTAFVVARKLYSIPGRAIDMTLHAIIPAASELDAREKKVKLKRLFLKTTKYSLALLFLLALPTIFMSRQLLQYWMEVAEEDYSIYYIVTNILIISIFFDYFNYVSSQILIGMKKIKFYVACYGIVALMNLVLSIVLVQRMGVEGVALGTTIPFIIMAPLFMWNTFRILDIKVREYAKIVLATTLPFALLVIIVLYALMYLHSPSNLIEVGVYYGISMGIFFLMFYFLGLDEGERRDIKGIFSAVVYKDDQEKT